MFKVNKSIYRCCNSVRKLLSKMAPNMEVTSAELRMLNLIAPKMCELDPVPMSWSWMGRIQVIKQITAWLQMWDFLLRFWNVLLLLFI